MYFKKILCWFSCICALGGGLNTCSAVTQNLGKEFSQSLNVNVLEEGMNNYSSNTIGVRTYHEQLICDVNSARVALAKVTNGSDYLKTPFGEATITFFKSNFDGRINVPGAGNYTKIIRLLQETITNPVTELYIPMRNFLINGQQVCDDNIHAARFYAVTMLADVCYGKVDSSDGGNYARYLLDRAINEKWPIENWNNSQYNPMCLKGAYTYMRKAIANILANS